MNNDDRMKSFRQNVQGLSPADRETRAIQYEGKLPGFGVGVNPVYGAVRQTALRMNAWIVARKTNEASFPFVGRPGYTPKDISCKPKTADRNNVIPWTGDQRMFLTAGLVASPELCPTSFSRDRFVKALDEWQKFARRYLDGRHGYQLNDEPGSPHYGCLRYRGKFIHGDLDLFDVMKPGAPDTIHADRIGNLTNSYTMLVRIAGELINGYLHTPMVLHGGQAQYGDFADEALLVFAPDGRAFELMSRIQARLWYATRWPNRVPVGVQADWLLRGG